MINVIKYLGVIFHSALTFDKQMYSVVKGSFFHLRTIAKLKSFLSFKDFKEIVIHALISSQIDSCNSLYYGICHSSLSRLQPDQNAAARMLTGTRKRDHISPILALLHWLPVKYRIDFKVLLLVFKALHGLAPLYISDLLMLYHTSRPLRSSNQFNLAIPQTRMKTKGDHGFSAVAPALWNKQHIFIRPSPITETFKSRLKIYFYSLAFKSV